MNGKGIVILMLIGFFGLASVAEAASISTRVRILESKVSKQNKVLRNHARESQQQNAKLDQGLKEVRELKVQVEKFMKEAEKKKKGQDDKRYAYP